MARRTREELRQLVLGAGLELLRDEGVHFGIEHLTFRRVFERIEDRTGQRIVPAMVYERIWKDQADFQREVLDVFIRAAFPSEQVENPLVDLLRLLLVDVDISTPDARWQAMRRLCREVGNATMGDVRGSNDDWITLVAAGAILSEPNPDDPQRFACPAIEESMVEQTRVFAEAFNAALHILGFRLKDGFTLGQAAMLTGSLAEGMHLRRAFFPDGFDEIILPGHEDEGPWSLYALGVLSVVESMAELDPDFVAD